MTTKDLIALLQEADPDGTTEVCVDNQAIVGVLHLGAYYDGALQQVFSDAPGRYPTSARVTKKGYKIVIDYLSIEDLIYDNPDFPVELPDGDDRWATRVAEWREQARKVAEQVEVAALLRRREQP